MNELDFFGFAAYFFVFVGGWYCQKKESSGWLMRMLGCLMWVVIGIRLSMFSIWLGELVFATQAWMAYREWKQNDAFAERMDNYDQANYMTDWQQDEIAALDDEDDFWPEIIEPTKINERDLLEKEYENVKCQKQGKGLATGRSVSSKKKVRLARGRRSVKANGKSRPRPNVKPTGTKKNRRNVRVQKNNRRTNIKSSRTGKV